MQHCLPLGKQMLTSRGPHVVLRSRIMAYGHLPMRNRCISPTLVTTRAASVTTRTAVQLHKQNRDPDYKTYLELSKPKLSTLVVLTTMSSYALSPFPAASLPTLFFLTSGTWLCCASANAFNMWLEPPFDSQMTRTRNRPLVRGALHPDQAFTFATATAVLGTSALYLGVNPICAGLGFANILLYAGLYTPLKRLCIENTWIGAVVGAIPPLMGWFAASPHPFFAMENLGALYLGLLLYSWQFPHFNSLSWYIRDEYARAGYVMTSISNPAMNARVSMRYSLLMFPVCFGLVHSGVCTEYFLLDSGLLNGYMTYYAYVFWRSRDGTQAKNKKATKLFFASLIYLPAVLVLAMFHKKDSSLGWSFLSKHEDDS